MKQGSRVAEGKLRNWLKMVPAPSHEDWAGI